MITIEQCIRNEELMDAFIGNIESSFMSYPNDKSDKAIQMIRTFCINFLADTQC